MDRKYSKEELFTAAAAYSKTWNRNGYDEDYEDYEVSKGDLFDFVARIDILLNERIAEYANLGSSIEELRIQREDLLASVVSIRKQEESGKRDLEILRSEFVRKDPSTES